MKRLFLAMVCATIGTTAVADEYSESTFSSNPVLRPITLPDSMVATGGALSYREKSNGDDDVELSPWIAYGVTDNFTIGLGGLTYRFYNDDGLQLAVNTGFRGASYDDKNTDDDDDDEWEVGGAISIFGKKVINDQLAFTFGVEYLGWDSDKDRSNRHEWDYSAGVIYQLAPGWTLNGGFTYRDLSNHYSQDRAKVYRAGLTRSFGNDFDVGLYYRHSDFEEMNQDSDYPLNYEHAGGVSATWRF